jgi:hypothetical protein
MRQDQWQNTLTIDGVPWGVWDTLQGGDVEADEVKYRPGGMANQVSLGGPSHVNNLTLARLLDKPDWPRMKVLMSRRVGRARTSVSRQPMDVDGNPFGQPLVYTGLLQHVQPGDTDSNASAAQQWTVIVSTDGGVS